MNILSIMNSRIAGNYSVGVRREGDCQEPDSASSLLYKWWYFLNEMECVKFFVIIL